jgi:hypothetical protein
MLWRNLRGLKTKSREPQQGRGLEVVGVEGIEPSTFPHVRGLTTARRWRLAVTT